MSEASPIRRVSLYFRLESMGIMFLLTPENSGGILAVREQPRPWHPARRKLVRIAYFDEAGLGQEPYLVVASVLIHGDSQWHPIDFLAEQIIQTMVPESLR
ncbi:MAG TPA: hypothetical protein VMR29_11975, partial [Candidatus Binatia bacterium]|nr:hypothetical protein [Candidatus Binatia bacterium]